MSQTDQRDPALGGQLSLSLATRGNPRSHYSCSAGDALRNPGPFLRFTAQSVCTCGSGGTKGTGGYGRAGRVQQGGAAALGNRITHSGWHTGRLLSRTLDHVEVSAKDVCATHVAAASLAGNGLGFPLQAHIHGHSERGSAAVCEVNVIRSLHHQVEVQRDLLGFAIDDAQD